VQRAFDAGEVGLNSRINVRLTEYSKNKETGEFEGSTKLWETTAGRALLSEILPKSLPFANINKALKKKEISKLINVSFRKCGLKETVVFADKLLQAGFDWRPKPVFPSVLTTCWCRQKSRKSFFAPKKRSRRSNNSMCLVW
jgi:DNA-directed RNA polymerase beta' subunit